MSGSYFDFIRHYYWDGRNALDIKAAKAFVTDIDGDDFDWDEIGLGGTEDALDALDAINAWLNDLPEAEGDGYTFSVGDAVVAVIDTESNLGAAWTSIDHLIEYYPELERVLGLWTFPKHMTPRTHAASI